MSPLVNSPQRGYTDYQRLDNYDSGTLATIAIAASAGNNTTGVLDVSRYNAIAGNLDCTQGIVLVFMQWYADSAGTQQLTGRRLFLDANIQRQMQFLLINQGPFVQIQFFAIGATAYSVSGLVHGTNRERPVEFMPVDPVIIDHQNQSIFASFTKVVWPLNYYSGPMRVWFQPEYAGAFVDVLAMNVNGTYDFIDSVSSSGTGANSEVTFVAPPGAWQMNVVNQGPSASTYYLAVTPSLTGSI